jgi:hypothetical protein
MTHQPDGSVSKVLTVFPEINITAYSRSKEEAASSVEELLNLFVPEGIWQLTTITVQAASEDSSVTRVTIVYSGT